MAMPQIPNSAFTITYTSIINRIHSPVYIEKSKLPGDASECSRSGELNGVWDTGATKSCISRDVAINLGLTSIGKIDVWGIGGRTPKDQYIVNVILPNRVRFLNLTVSEGDLKGFDVLIGMDIMSQGDVAFSNYDKKSAFSFRLPSCGKTDYSAQAKLQKKIGPPHGKGSGKKRH